MRVIFWQRTTLVVDQAVSQQPSMNGLPLVAARSETKQVRTLVLEIIEKAKTIYARCRFARF